MNLQKGSSIPIIFPFVETTVDHFFSVSSSSRLAGKILLVPSTSILPCTTNELGQKSHDAGALATIEEGNVEAGEFSLTRSSTLPFLFHFFHFFLSFFAVAAVHFSFHT